MATFRKWSPGYAAYVRNLPAGDLGGEDHTDFGRDLRRTDPEITEETYQQLLKKK